MAYAESALSKLNKDDLIRIALDMEKTQNSILSDIRTNYLRQEKITVN